MRSRICIIAAALAAATLLLAQNPGNDKPNGRGDRLNGVASTAALSGNAGPLLLNYHGGPVILGQTHIYYIWYGNWSVDPNAAPILNALANNLTGSPYYNILTQYSQTNPSGNISNSVVLGGSTNSTYVAANPLALTDNDISGIVQAAIGNNSLPLDANGVYFVLTAPGVAETSGFLSIYCGYHSSFSLSNTWINYAFIGDAAGPNLNKCAEQTASSPNNDPSVDAMASIIAHELSEAVTDPLFNAWYDLDQQEVADKCAFTFGTTFAAPNGSMANVTLGGFDFLLQQNFSNASDSCVMSYQSPADYSLSVSPGTQSAVQGGTTGNYTVTVNPTNGFSNGVTLSVTGLPAGATLNGPAPNPTSTTATFNISTGTAATGSYPLTITGTSGALTHMAAATLVVVNPDYSLSVSPGSRSAGTGNTTQPYTITVNPTNGFAGMVTFAVTGLPTGASLNPAPASSSISSTFAVAVGTSAPGTYTLTITGTSGSLSHGVNATLIVTSGSSSGFPSRVGVFRSGFYWLEDVDGNQQFNQPPDQAFAFGGVAGDIPITGDWNGDGRTKVGVYRPSNGLFILDTNGNQQFDGGDAVYNLGVGTQAGDVPVVGDWNGDGRTKVGLFRQGFFWILDTNGNGTFEQGVDATYAFGGVAGDVPVVGDWTGSGTSKIGLFRMGFYWILDANGNGVLDNINGAGGDLAFAYGGIAGDVPVVGDWNGDSTSKVGVFRQGFFWVLDANGNHTFDGTGSGQDLAFAFGGISGDVPVAGKWSLVAASSIAATSGTPQTTQINTAFAAPLAATLTNSGSPLAGVVVTFAAPTSGASGTFTGGATTATATTNASGIATSPTFTANGTNGSYGVSASAPGVSSPASFSLTNVIPPNMIGLPANVNVPLGEAITFPVTLGTSAPAGGVFVTLSSSDSVRIAVSPAQVFIAQGAYTPAVQPTLSAFNTGTVTIGASAPGYISATQHVNATATVTFSPLTITTTSGAVERVLLSLSSAAPPGTTPAGRCEAPDPSVCSVTVALSSDNPNVALVQPSVSFFPDGSSQAIDQIQISAVGPGTTVIHAGAPPYIPDATLTVTVQ